MIATQQYSQPEKNTSNRFKQGATLLLLCTFFTAAQAATVISPNEAIRVHFDFTGSPDPEVDGFQIWLRNGWSHGETPVSPLPDFQNMSGTISFGAMELGTSYAEVLDFYEPEHLRVFNFYSTSSPVGTSKIDFSSILAGTPGWITIRSTAAYEFDFDVMKRPFESNLVSWKTQGGTMVYTPHYSRITKFEVIEFSPAIPEPSTYSLLLVGLGLIGVFSRRSN